MEKPSEGTEKNEVSNVTKMKKPSEGTERDEVIFTVEEGEMLAGILNHQGQATHLKDLRLLDLIVNRVEKATPKRPDRPIQPKLEEGEDAVEAHKIFSDKVNEWTNIMIAFPSQEIDLTFENIHLGVIRQRMANFSSYNAEASARKKIIALADKLGVK